jgi:hypothetical protein
MSEERPKVHLKKSKQLIQAEVDILENDILETSSEVLNILLRDHTTKRNIFWATENYQDLGIAYQFSSTILPELITGQNGHVIMPRVKKNKNLQQTRVKAMAEVYTPSWICNDQNNGIDKAWFLREDVFNKRIVKEDGSVTWQVNEDKIAFPKGKTWVEYINLNCLEITCGEAPYLTSRYDATTGVYIPVNYRIGLLDRKLRVINENVDNEHQWLEAAYKAYKSIYGYEFQGDSLLLAREALLYTFIENYRERFMSEPALSNIQDIAYIVSWNIWQMDGLKCVVPRSCVSKNIVEENLFHEFIEKKIKCEGCSSENIHKHNGTYCFIMDWNEKDPKTGELGLKIRFIDLLTK